MEIGFESTDMVELGRAIRSIREAAGMTVAELAKAAGSLTRPSLTRIELGHAQSASFDSVYRILMVVGELPIVRGGEFDLRPYSKEIQNLILFFTRNDDGSLRPSYKQDVSRQIAEGCEDWSKDEIDGLLVQIQCRNGMYDVRREVANLSQALSDSAMTAEGIDGAGVFAYIEKWTHFMDQYRMFISQFKQDGMYEELFSLVRQLVEHTKEYVQFKRLTETAVKDDNDSSGKHSR